ncbi:MAG: hypothetical protein CM15mP58_18780 [Burkholderiaceae bacterium]|nr:MAG: hypothetical protein CM15mP58_18780 [Burkholderiaceae bacterium]
MLHFGLVKASDYIPFINIAPVVAGNKWDISNFFNNGWVTGGIGLDLKNWRKKLDASGNIILDEMKSLF